MNDQNDNPMGLDGFEFVEFSAPDPEVLKTTFRTLGFTPIAHHRSKDVTLYRQGDINFILNNEPKSMAAHFAAEHGPGACGMAFRVGDAHYAYDRALEMGAMPMDIPTGPMELRLPAIRGIGGAVLYLVDRYGDDLSIYDIDFKYIAGADKHPEGCGLNVIDHLTHNVYRGRMAYWAEYYEKIFNFRELRHFDIKGKQTALNSKAMTAPDGKIRIPLNEEAAGSSGQIEEYLMAYNGEGIQHIALATDDIYDTYDRLKANGMPFMTPPPDTYYEMLEERLPGHGEDVDALQKRGLLLDGTTEGDTKLLLQIFTETSIGPVFFEIIQRKKDEGFGEGNFQALFESMERDQMRRGVITESDAS